VGVVGIAGFWIPPQGLPIRDGGLIPDCLETADFDDALLTPLDGETSGVSSLGTFALLLLSTLLLELSLGVPLLLSIFSVRVDSLILPLYFKFNQQPVYQQWPHNSIKSIKLSMQNGARKK
jgi:hypothetical protein